MFQEAYKQNVHTGDPSARRFVTPLRRVFKRFHASRKRPAPGASLRSTNILADSSNIPAGPYPSFENGAVIIEEKPNPPPAPRPSRLVSPGIRLTPISPLAPTVSSSSNLLINHAAGFGLSHDSPQATNNSAIPSSSSPLALMPRGDLFQCGLTPIQSVRTIHSIAPNTTSGCTVFAPALPTTQRVSSVNIARVAAGVDMMDFVDVSPGEAEQTTPTPPSRTVSLQWLPSLVTRRKGHNLSTSALEVNNSVEERRTSNFMAKLVGSAWGFAGIGFNSMNGHRRTQSTAPPATASAVHETGIPSDSDSLPLIPLGKCSIERAVLDTASRLSPISNASDRESFTNGLLLANSAFRMTGSKSGRALDGSDYEIGSSNEKKVPEHEIEERPKKKRRGSVAEHLIRSTAPCPTPGRVTRAMAARQAEIEAMTPTRVTRSASKRLAELANAPARKSCDELYLDDEYPPSLHNSISTSLVTSLHIHSHPIQINLSLVMPVIQTPPRQQANAGGPSPSPHGRLTRSAAARSKAEEGNIASRTRSCSEQTVSTQLTSPARPSIRSTPSCLPMNKLVKPAALKTPNQAQALRIPKTGNPKVPTTPKTRPNTRSQARLSTNGPAAVIMAPIPMSSPVDINKNNMGASLSASLRQEMILPYYDDYVGGSESGSSPFIEMGCLANTDISALRGGSPNWSQTDSEEECENLLGFSLQELSIVPGFPYNDLGMEGLDTQDPDFAPLRTSTEIHLKDTDMSFGDE
ncbi:hypothetical protein CTheo_7412 [Ceratobasidium theobromae]|uniref:Uncharacterized protein n=1 Tax=Ceratobasidium theobromae TaxID=1582974 RepID=A0A5N5QCA7_9AGAM|nr:hypothetical protein CTheo_7412 [Ceratobasidium theobromae]